MGRIIFVCDLDERKYDRQNTLCFVQTSHSLHVAYHDLTSGSQGFGKHCAFGIVLWLVAVDGAALLTSLGVCFVHRHTLNYSGTRFPVTPSLPLEPPKSHFP